MPLSQDPVGAVTQADGYFGFSWGGSVAFVSDGPYKGALGVHDNLSHLNPTPLHYYAESGFDEATGLFRGPSKIACTGQTTIWLWGDQGVGIAGSNPHQEVMATADANTHVDPTGGPNLSFIDVTAGGCNQAPSRGGVFLGIDVLGDVYGWGHNFNGQLGQGDTTERPPPAFGTTIWSHVTYGTPAVRVHAGNGHALVLDALGRVWSAGLNNRGQLGRGTIGVDSTTWGQVPPPSGGRTYTEIAACGDDTLLVVSDGTVIGCGRNTLGSLGPTALTPGGSTLGVVLPNVSNVVEAMSTAGQSYFRTVSGDLYAMGTFRFGSDGGLIDPDGVTLRNDSITEPLLVRLDWAPNAGPPYSGNTGVKCAKLGYVSGNADFSVGSFPQTTSVIGTDGKLYTYTLNGNGERGDGTQTLNANSHIFENYLDWQVTSVTYAKQMMHVVGSGTLSTYHLPLWTGGVAKTYRGTGANDPSVPMDWFLTAFDDTAAGWDVPVLITPDPVYPADDALNRGEPVWPTATEAGGARMLARWHMTPPAETAAQLSQPGVMMRVFGYNQDTGPSLRRSVAHRLGLITPSTSASIPADTTNTRVLGVIENPFTPPASWQTLAFDDSAWIFGVEANRQPGSVIPTGTVAMWESAALSAHAVVLYRFHFTLPAGTIQSAALVISLQQQFIENVSQAEGIYVNGNPHLFPTDLSTPPGEQQEMATFSIPAEDLIAGAANVIAYAVIFIGSYGWCALRLDVNYGEDLGGSSEVYWVNGILPATVDAAITSSSPTSFTAGADNVWAYRTANALAADFDPTCWAQLDVLLAYIATSVGVPPGTVSTGPRAFAFILG